MNFLKIETNKECGTYPENLSIDFYRNLSMYECFDFDNTFMGIIIDAKKLPLLMPEHVQLAIDFLESVKEKRGIK